MAANNNQNDFHLSENGFRILRELEKPRHAACRDSGGKVVVGFRHTGNDVIDGRIYTDQEIMDFFNSDKARIEHDVNKIYDPLFMNQNMFDACFLFAFSVGNISNTELGRIISKNPYDDRLHTMWLSTYTNSGKSKNLVKRRQIEHDLYFKFPDDDEEEHD